MFPNSSSRSDNSPLALARQRHTIAISIQFGNMVGPGAVTDSYIPTLCVGTRIGLDLLVFSPDGISLASGDDDKSINILGALPVGTDNLVFCFRFSGLYHHHLGISRQGDSAVGYSEKERGCRVVVRRSDDANTASSRLVMSTSDDGNGSI